jgi:microcin C transport system permease protein
MRTYLIRRILMMIPMFFLMTGVYFTIQNFLPGGPVQDALARIRGAGGEGGGGKSMDIADIEALRKDLERQYGLDKPIGVRYIKWVGNVLRMDFGDSSATRRPAIDTIVERIPISLGFGIPGFFLTYLVCVVLGVVKARRDGTVFDNSSSFILFVAYSVPPLVLSVLLLLFFCTDRFLPHALFPLGGAYSDSFDQLSTWGKIKDYSWHMFLPVCTMLVGSFTVLTILMKNSMLDVLGSDFIRTARAKGLGEGKVVFKHALRNAVLPLMVGLGSFLGVFVAGSIVIESVFGLPGMSLLLLESLSSRDYNVLMGVAVLQALVIMVGQLMSDIAYVLVDPRIDFK